MRVTRIDIRGDDGGFVQIMRERDGHAEREPTGRAEVVVMGNGTQIGSLHEGYTPEDLTRVTWAAAAVVFGTKKGRVNATNSMRYEVRCKIELVADDLAE